MIAYNYLSKLKQMEVKIKNNMEELQSLQILKNKVAPVLCGGDVQDCRSPEQDFKCMAKIEKVKEALDAEIATCLDYKKTGSHIGL